MKVLFLNTEKGWRGGERQTILTMREMRSMGVTVELVTRQETPLADVARSDGFVVHASTQFIELLIWLYRHAENYQAFHAHTALTATVLSVFRFLTKKPIFFTRRTDFCRPSRGWIRRIKWQQFNHIIAISRAAAQEPIRLGLRPLIVRSAVPHVQSKQIRLQKFLEQHELIGKTLIGTAAVFTADKDPLSCIRAAADLCAMDPNVVFLHWGTGGELEECCRSYVADLNLERRYLFLGFMPDPEELYPCLSAFISTSRTEALGTSVLDAMVQHIPVVATSVGGLKETLQTGRGILVPPESPMAMIEAVKWVLDNPIDASQMSERAYAYVRQEHDVKKLAKRYVEIYSKVIMQGYA